MIRARVRTGQPSSTTVAAEALTNAAKHSHAHRTTPGRLKGAKT